MLSIVRKRLQQRSVFKSTFLDVSACRLLILHFSSGSDDVNKSPTKTKTGQPEEDLKTEKFKADAPGWVKELLASRMKSKSNKPQGRSSYSKGEVIDVIKKALPQAVNPKPQKKINWNDEVHQVMNTITGPNQKAKQELQQKVQTMTSFQPVEELLKTSEEIWSSEQSYDRMNELAKVVRPSQAREEVEKAISGSDVFRSRKQQAQKSTLQRKESLGLHGDGIENVEAVISATHAFLSQKGQAKQRRLQMQEDANKIHKVVSEIFESNKWSSEQFEQFNQKEHLDQAPGLVKRTRMFTTTKEKRISKIKSIEDLFSKETLGIFDLRREGASSESIMKTWSFFEDRDVKITAKLHGPSNWWDQCIQWTDEGKLWHFPINNEQGMDKEAEVSFAEHVFLDEHIEDWCPREGPIRHFMELVMVGLSKNPYITVEEKVEYLNWYRDYFEKHRTLLEEINALGSATDSKLLEQKV